MCRQLPGVAIFGTSKPVYVIVPALRDKVNQNFTSRNLSLNY